MNPVISSSRVFASGPKIGLILGLTFFGTFGQQTIFAEGSKAKGAPAVSAPGKNAVDIRSDKTANNVAGNPADAGPKDRVRYTKSKKLDFNSQTVEGVLQRPETALITASETLSTNGILRLREDFLDKYAADIGEPVP